MIAELLDLPLRIDALPEERSWPDTGCRLHPRCLTCPLPRCVYDEPAGIRSVGLVDRDAEIRELRAAGTKIRVIAQRFGISRRSVFRVLAEHRRVHGAETRRKART